MPVPNTKLSIGAALAAGSAVRFTPNTPGDFQPIAAGVSVPPLVAATTDMNGDGRADIIFGAPQDSDKALGAGRVFVELARSPVAPGSAWAIPRPS